jgi:DNA polymerase III epsilon subunit-like protein
MHLFLDTETTGITQEDRIVSICWAFYDDAGDEVSTEHHIICPDRFTIPSDAARIHGITTEIALRRGIPLVAALALLHNHIAHHAPTLYVGHNVSFDRPIVLNEYARIHVRENLSPLPTYCTMKRTTQLCALPQVNGRGYKWPTLAELHRHLFGCAHKTAHDAEGDVRACAKCFFELRTRGLIS